MATLARQGPGHLCGGVEFVAPPPSRVSAHLRPRLLIGTCAHHWPASMAFVGTPVQFAPSALRPVVPALRGVPVTVVIASSLGLLVAVIARGQLKTP